MRYSTTVLSLVFLAGAAASAHAQSVANLPPAGTPTLQPRASSAPQVAAPNPGSNVGIPGAEAYQKPADWDSNRTYHLYSTSGAAPNPGSNVSANNTEASPLPPTAAVNAPYSSRSAGTGPSPGR